MRSLLFAGLLTMGGLAQAADQVRTLAPFTSISNAGPVSLTIDVGKPQSVVASGSDEHLARLITEVVDGELRVRYREGSPNFGSDNLRLTITVPQFTRLNMSGAGGTTITHETGDALEINLSGAGSLKASGQVKRLEMTLSGVGSVDTTALHASEVTATVGGVGSVRLWADDRLDATVGGIGSVTYFGNPKSVNTRSGGIGSIHRGD